MINDFLNSFLRHLEEQIEEHKKSKETATTSDGNTCPHDFPMAQEAMAYLDFASDIIKVLGDTFNEMETSSGYNTELEEEKTFLAIANSYSEGVLADLGAYIKETPIEIEPVKDNYNYILDIYAKNICRLQNSISEANSLLAEIDGFLVPNPNFKTNDEIDKARKNLEDTIENGESVVTTFYNSFQPGKQIEWQNFIYTLEYSEFVNSVATLIDNTRSNLIFEIKYPAKSFFKNLLESTKTLFSLWKEDAATYTPDFNRIPDNVRSIRCSDITEQLYLIEYKDGSIEKIKISELENRGYVRKK